MNELSPSKRNRAIVGGYQSLREDLARRSPDRFVPLILIKENVCRLLEARLREDGFNVLNVGQSTFQAMGARDHYVSPAARKQRRESAKAEVIGLPRKRPSDAA